MMGDSSGLGPEPTGHDLMKVLNANAAVLEGIREEISKVAALGEQHSRRIGSAENRIQENALAIVNLEVDNEVIKENIDDVTVELERVKQSQLKNSLEIVGVPIKTGENVTNVCINLLKFLSVDIDERDINSCSRAGRTPRQLSNGETVYPHIYLDLVRESIKLKVFEQIKKRHKAIKTTDLGFTDFAASTIYVNHRFTPYMKNIYLAGLKVRNKGLLKFYWYKDGLVHGRVEEGSKVLTFLRIEDVEALTEESANETDVVAAVSSAGNSTPNDSLGVTPSNNIMNGQPASTSNHDLVVQKHKISGKLKDHLLNSSTSGSSVRRRVTRASKLKSTNLNNS